MLWKLLVFLLSLVVAISILTNPTLHQLILSLGNLEYLGGFIAGFFFIFTFTVIPSSAAIFLLADTLNPILLSGVAGVGAMFGDYILYRLFRKEKDEIVKVDQIRSHSLFKKLTKSKMISWLLIILGGLIIASPFPDELGIALLGISRLETKRFLPLSFILNSAGIFVIVGVGKIF